MPTDQLSLNERIELIEQVRDYLGSIGDASWLNKHEVEALLHLHGLLLNWLGE